MQQEINHHVQELMHALACNYRALLIFKRLYVTISPKVLRDNIQSAGKKKRLGALI
jgi:hypothetical protein